MMKIFPFRIKVFGSASASAKTAAACAQSIKRPSDGRLAMSGTRKIDDCCSAQQFGEGIARAEAGFSAG